MTGTGGGEEGRFQHPLVTRYASPEMLALFSEVNRIRTWRRLWIALAEAQAELDIGGVTIAQVAALREAADHIQWERAVELERELRHDVMAHVHLFGEAAPQARPILHLGATSAFVVDNGDQLVMRDALRVVQRKTLCVVAGLAGFADRHADLPALAWTHLQPAQPTTVGKRACLWLQDLLLDLDEIDQRLGTFRLRGLKGTTGTQASFLALAGGDHDKVRELERRLLAKLDAERAFAVTGQTYPRKVDAAWAGTLRGVAVSASKFSQDLRFLQHVGEILEPFGQRQIGSSAMPYKRNPMRAERMTGLARLALQLAGNLDLTAAAQWLERTLDDSANKRIAFPELFLTVDSLLILYHDVAEGLEVQPGAIRRNLERELPFLASERVLMEAVERGGDRQALHEQIRVHAREVAARLESGESNDLLSRLSGEEAFGGVSESVWREAGDPARHVGRAPEQVREFLRDEVRPRLAAYPGKLEMTGEVRV